MRIGYGEILFVLGLLLLLFGAPKLPELAQSLGKAFKAFRKEIRELREEVELEKDTKDKP